MTDELPGFRKFITEATENDVEALLEKMREHNLPVEHSFFATIHRKSDDRPDGFTDEDLDEIAEQQSAADRKRWEEALENHLKSLRGA